MSTNHHLVLFRNWKVLLIIGIQILSYTTIIHTLLRLSFNPTILQDHSFFNLIQQRIFIFKHFLHLFTFVLKFMWISNHINILRNETVYIASKEVWIFILLAGDKKKKNLYLHGKYSRVLSEIRVEFTMNFRKHYFYISVNGTHLSTTIFTLPE